MQFGHVYLLEKYSHNTPRSLHLEVIPVWGASFIVLVATWNQALVCRGTYSCQFCSFIRQQSFNEPQKRSRAG
eukprot:4724288-Pleurochrysis_carterae.AAC.1